MPDIHLQSKTENKIIEALKELKLNYFIDLGTELLDEIAINEPYLNNQLKEKTLNKYPELSVREYDSTIDLLKRIKSFILLMD